MTELIPAIIPQSFDEIKQKIKLLEPFIFRQDGEEPFIRSVQLDIMDGKFVESTTWNNPEELKSFSEPVNFEAHLMVENPEIYVENWLYSGVVRIITHIEATTDPDLLIKLCHDAGIQYGIALNPETSNEKIISWIDKVDEILFLAVKPGRGGQEFQKPVLDKIKKLRSRYLNVKIGVDGGIKVGIARQVKEAGADMVIAGSAIFKAPNIGNALMALVRDVR
ncbi:hypothetical protein A2608_02290 [Candidatus Azambacteria bacterium RIFOXYD1_FULL_44_10]|uniref:Ribulose-phosphate 3-epimerase n=1 Tax=Candidatus Azambacteria bacterium RIFCSPLOWO2_02_FULL_44_14 TaxID=1797306 RepID=A0A1F5C9X3_9BACT|nr:MAG: hypothetical protein A3C78_02475 [Candidatus Azambacteria bacterium RIFCSPHIGHO2_02_FULL_45_18]OGD39647.1 MAG: hypothetical protein A3I30_04090 [Candidatus Azambacteria bacterium RIFCSPLOWO2_02_FULL_44_14]OGD51942.1 MAG: hypothetical protein A2608_02290 [Candidatus Azambacteria bacterium RIFOXYD1_FULL_44_10]